MTAVVKKFKLEHCRESEHLNGHKGGVWLSAENGEESKEGWPLFNYWSENYTNYEFGVHNEFREFVEAMGWFCEWHDAGTLMLWPQ